MNCGGEVGDTACIFAEVLVCPTCHLMATRLYDHLMRDLQGCLLMAKDKIREKLATGGFVYTTTEDRPPVSKQELFTAITEMYNRKDAEPADRSLPPAVPARSEGRSS